MLDGHGSAGTYFDTSVFSQPTGATFGNSGRNQFRGPGAWNLDFSLFRAFPFMGGGKRLEFRAEFFNLLNHPNFAFQPGADDENLDVTSANFGRMFTVGTGARDAGTGERRIRFGLRLQF